MGFSNTYRATARPVTGLGKGMAIAVAALLAGCASLTGHGKAETASVPRGPAGNSFYAPPAPLPAGKHGDVIWARHLTNNAALPDASANWLVLYRSTDIAGNPVAVSGTVAIPKGQPPKGGWPVISWTHGTTGIADICAPSRDDGDYPAKGYVNLINADLDKWLKRGYAVVKSDYQGLGTPGTHPYLVGDSEARGATDMVLAARQIDPHLSRDWLVMGHSQGGQAALYTASLGPVYAPDLNLTGAIAISPASHLSEQVQYAETHPDKPANAYGALIMEGIAAVAPGVDLSKLLTREGQKRIALVDQRCVGQLRGPDAWGLKTDKLMNTKADFKPLNNAIASLEDPETLRPLVPLLVLQADNDHTVLKPFTDMTVARYKDLGVNVDYRTYHIGDKGKIPSNHIATVPDSFKDALAWGERHLPPGR